MSDVFVDVKRDNSNPGRWCWRLMAHTKPVLDQFGQPYFGGGLLTGADAKREGHAALVRLLRNGFRPKPPEPAQPKPVPEPHQIAPLDPLPGVPKVDVGPEPVDRHLWMYVFRIGDVVKACGVGFDSEKAARFAGLEERERYFAQNPRRCSHPGCGAATAGHMWLCQAHLAVPELAKCDEI